MSHVSKYELQQLVRFFYNAEYDDDSEEAGLSPLQLHARMFSLADQYDVLDLDNLAAEKYRTRCIASWEPLEFLRSIPVVYESSADCMRRLRDIACATCRHHLPGMLDGEDIAQVFEMTLLEVPDFAKDLLVSYIHNPLYGRCSSCGPDQAMRALQARCKKCSRGTGYWV